MTPYQYVHNNPIMFTDPTGMSAEKEYPNNYTGRLGMGDWKTSDRVNNTDRWKNANSFNLQRTDGAAEYENIEQRADFYRWFQGATDAKGFDTRWAGAAAKVADGINELANPSLLGVSVEGFADLFSYSSSEARTLANEGNRIIFEDVFPKLRDLYNGSPLKDNCAYNWDAMALSQEQHLVQPFYTGSKAFGVVNAASKQLLVGSSFLAKSKGINISPFPRSGNMRDINQRWEYGMKEMNYNVSPCQMPDPGYFYKVK